MKVFIDTNILLDVLAERKPFYNMACRICELIEKGKLRGYLSASSITDIFYIIKKCLGRQLAYETVEKLMMVFGIVSIPETDIRKALKVGLRDFEDGLQLVCAKKIKAGYLITRNKEDFQDMLDKELVDPEEFLAIWDSEHKDSRIHPKK